MSGAHTTVLRSQKFNKATSRKSARTTNVTAQASHARHVRDVARQRRIITLTGLEINDAENNFRIQLPTADFCEDLHLIVKLKAVTGGGTYRNIPVSMNLFKYIALTSGSQKVQEFNEPRSVFNYYLQTCDTQTYDSAKKILGSSIGNASAADSILEYSAPSISILQLFNSFLL